MMCNKMLKAQNTFIEKRNELKKKKKPRGKPRYKCGENDEIFWTLHNLPNSLDFYEYDHGLVVYISGKGHCWIQRVAQNCS